MTYIKRTDGLEATVSERVCLTVSSMPDQSVTVAEVEETRAGDIEITKSEFNTLLAQIASTMPIAVADEPTLNEALADEMRGLKEGIEQLRLALTNTPGASTALTTMRIRVENMERKYRGS